MDTTIQAWQNDISTTASESQLTLPLLWKRYSDLVFFFKALLGNKDLDAHFPTTVGPDSVKKNPHPYY